MDMNASILVDTIFLLINENSDTTRRLANQLIILFKEAKIVDTDDSEIIRFYIRVLHRIISEKLDKTSMDSLRSLILKMKSEAIFSSHKQHLLDLEKTVNDPNRMSDTERNKLKRNIGVVIRSNEYAKQVRSMYASLEQMRRIDSLDARSEALKEFEQRFNHNVTSDDDSGYDGPKPQDSISSKDTEGLTDAFVKVHNRRTGGSIQTGRIDLNKAFGKERKLASDTSICIIAPSHNGKSIMINDMAYWTPAYNDFPIKEDGSKPLIYLASTENGAQENYLYLYEKIYYEKYGKPAPKIRVDENKKPLKEDIDERVKLVTEFYEEHNVELLIEAYAAHEFGPVDYVNRLKYLMSQGYYIVLACFDYLMKSKLPTAAREDLAVAAGFNLVCNFTKHHGIMFCTGHQYTRDGVIRLDGKIDKVKSMNPGGVRGGYDAFQIVDVVIYVILETDHNGVQYTTMKLDKHRYVNDTPPGDKYVAYPIIDGMVKDDINEKQSRGTKDIYSEGMNVASGYQPKGEKKSDVTEKVDDPF